MLLQTRINWTLEASVDREYRARLLKTMRENNALHLTNLHYLSVMSAIMKDGVYNQERFNLDAAYAHGQMP